MTFVVSGGALNFTHSLIQTLDINGENILKVQQVIGIASIKNS